MLGAAVLISAATPIAANAATYFFDGNGTTAGLGSFTTATGASGSPYTWNDGTTNAQAALWSSTSGGTSAVSAASFTTSDIAQFNNTNGATSGTAVFYNVNIANGANVNINGISTTNWNTNVVIGAAGTTGKITFGGSTPTITNPGSGGSITINAVIDGSSGLTIAGTGGGTTLTATNIFTGGLAITGLVNVSSIGNSNASSQLGAGAVTLNGGTLNYTGSGETSARQFTYGLSSGTIQNNGSGALTLSGAPLYSATNAVRTITLAGSNTNDNTFSGLIANNGTGVVALSKSGAGKWILSNNNTYTGVTTISGGTLAVSSIGNGGTAGNLGQATNAASNLVITGGTLQYTGSGETTNRGITFGVSGTTLDASGSGAIVFSNSAIAVDFNNSPRTATFTGSNTGDNEFKGVITDSGTGKTAIVKNGAGKWILSGANTATGIVRIDAGTLSVSSIGNGGAAGGLGQASNAAANLIIATGTLKYTGSGETTDRAITFGGTAGTTPTIDSSGSGALILSASAHAYGSVVARTITLTGSNTNNNEIQGVIANGSNGNNSIVKSGAGKWVLSGTNTFTNGVTINAGTLSVATIGNGGQNGNLGASSTTAANLTLGGGTLQYTGSTASTDRNFVLTASTASTIDVSTAGSSLTISGASTNTSGSLTKAGAGTLALSGNNLSTGGMTVSAGTLRAITSTGALGAGTLTLSGGNLELANDTGVNFARNTTVSANTTIKSDRLTSGAGVTHTLGTLSIGANSLQLSAGSNSTSGTAALTFGATTLTGAATLNTDANTNLTVGAIGGNFNLTKSGTGTLTMTGANTSTGDLNIGAGTVTVNSVASLANNNINVGTAGSSGTVLNVSAITPTFTSSQKIGGIGTINATGKTVSVAGTWAPGNSIGTNAVTGNLTITGTSQIELGTAGASRTSYGTSDSTDVTGNLTLSNSTISLIDNAGANSNGSLGAGAYRIFTYTGTYTGSSVTVSALADTTKRASIYNGGSGTGSGNGIFAEVYNLASAAATQTVNIGNFRVGSSKNGTATITNASAVNATYTEQLATGTITPGTGATSSGSFSGVAGGSTGNITVGLSTASTAGAKSGTVTVGLNSTAVNSSGLSNQAITSQVITVNGAAYDTANAGYATTTKAFGNVRVGSSPATQNISFTNAAITNASYQDSLDVSGSKTNSKITLGNGFNVAAGASPGNLSVDANTATAGSLADTITLSLTSNANSVSGLSNSSITPAGTIAVTGNVYDYANAGYATTTKAFGNVRVGSSPATQNISFTNAAITNASYQDSLDVSGSKTNSKITLGNGFNVAAGASPGNLSVDANTATAGSLADTITLSLTSNANSVSGLSNSSITPAGTIAVTGNVYDYAQANYNGAALDFGYVHQGASVSNQTVAIGNKTITNASYQDLLDVSGSSTNGKVSVTGFNGLAASTNGATTDNVSVGIDSSLLGSLSGTVNLTLTSNANGVAGLSNGTASRSGTGAITTTGAVYSGLGTWATNGNGSWGRIASGFGTNWGSNEGSPGLDAGYTNTDTATFGNAISSDATVSLNGASPKLKSITFNNTSASYTLAQGSAGNITLNAGTGDSAATIDVTGNHEISAVLAGSSAVNKTGTGNLTLSGVNTYSGQTNINAGTLTLKDSGKLNGNAVVADTATLAANNSGTANIISGNLTLADGGAIDLQNGGLSIGGNVTLNGGLINYVSGNTIAVTGALTLTSSVNVDLKGTLALGTYDLFTGYTSITGGNYFNLITSDPSFSLSTSLAGGKFSVIVSASGSIISGTHVFNTAQTLTTISGGTVTLNASGNTIGTISGGSIAVNDDTEVTTLNGGAVAVANGKKFKASSGNTSGVISGAGQLIKEGASKLTLTGNNTFTGKTVVEDGTLAISNVSTGNNAQALGKHASVDLGVANTSSGTLEYTGGTGTLDKNINALGNGNNKIYNNGSGALTLSGNLTKTGTILDLDGGSNGITVSGVISGNSGNYDSDLVVSGGTVTLTNQNTYVGPTYVYGGGTLRNGNASGALPTNTILTLGNASDNSAGTFDLYGNNQTVAGIATAGTAGSSNKITNSVTSTATLTVTNGGAFAGKIEDGGIGKVTALAVTGGNLILSNTSNDYTGGTTISSGANVTATGTHSLGNGDVTVNSGGTLTMLASTVGTAGTGVTYTLNGGSNLIMKFASVSGAGTFSNWYGQQLYDQSANAGINYSTLEMGASGFLDLTGASAGNKINLILQSNNMSANTTGLIRGRLYTFTLATMGALQWNGGDITSLFDLDLSNFRYADGSQFDTNTFYQISYLNGDSLVLTIPEPSTYGLMLGGLALAAAAVRRQRQKKKATEAEAKA